MTRDKWLLSRLNWIRLNISRTEEFKGKESSKLMRVWISTLKMNCWMFLFIGALFYRRNLLEASDTVHIDTRMETLLSERHNQCSFCWLYVLCSFQNTLDEGMLLEVLMSFAKLQGWFSAVTVRFFFQCNVLRSVISIWFEIRVFFAFLRKIWFECRFNRMYPILWIIPFLSGFLICIFCKMLHFFWSTEFWSVEFFNSQCQP